MIRLAVRRLWTGRLQAFAPLIALLAATVGFQVVLVSARASQSHVQGVIAANWNPPYDLLVRPPSLVTGLAPGDHLIRPNYLDSAQGGVTMAQVATVRATAGVSVAAPVGVVAVDVLSGNDYSIDVAALPHTSDLNIYRVSTTFTTDGGSSTIAGQNDSNRFIVVQGSKPPYVTIPGSLTGYTIIDILGAKIGCVLWCFTAPSRVPATSAPPYHPPWGGDRFPFEALMTTPIVAVDPAAESALSGLDRCLVAGRNLITADGVTLSRDRTPDGTPSTIPILVNARPGFDDRFHVTVEAADSTAPLVSSLIGGKPGPREAVPGFPRSVLENVLTYHKVADFSSDLNQAWNGSAGIGFLHGGTLYPSATVAVDTLGPVTYRGTAPNLVAQTSSVVSGYDAYTGLQVPNPPETDPYQQFHPLTTDADVGVPWHAFKAVGKYDPSCVTKGSPVARSAFDIYANPDTTTPSGTPLGPNPAITNYVTPMPAIMTNLAGGAYFSDPQRFALGQGDAFLSVVRVKVSGTDQPGPLSQTRLERVAAEIHRRTGLAVDIIKGSSTRAMSIQLPAGHLGRPPMTVHEDWLVENVAINFVSAINTTTVVMSTVVTVVAVLLMMQATYAAVRRRRGELVLLRAVGWPAWRLALLMELEVVGLGVLVAVIALVAAAVIILVNHPTGVVLTGLVLAPPAAIALTVFAGLGPALTASNTRPLATLRGPGRLRRRRRRLIRGPFTLGIREALTTWRWQTLIGAIATAVGAMFLGAVLAIIRDFHASLDSTALAQQLSTEVGPFDVLLGVLAVLLGATTAVSVVLVATRERLPHLATLRALGWSRIQVARLIAGQGLAVGFLGGILGAIALALLTNRVKAGLILTRTSLLSTLALGLATGVTAAVGAVRLVFRRIVVAVLRAG